MINFDCQTNKIIRMKNTYLAALILLTLYSCGSNQDDVAINNKDIRIKMVKEYLTDRLSEVEMKSFNYSEFEISDREAYGEIWQYYMDWADHKNRVGKDPSYYFSLADSITKNHVSNAKGNIAFYKIVATKLSPDTIHHSVLYFNDKNELILPIHRR
jgi:hypothetical protein